MGEKRTYTISFDVDNSMRYNVNNIELPKATKMQVGCVSPDKNN